MSTLCVTAPTWNEFNEILSGNEAPKPRTVIGYGALFPQSPTDPAVVQEKCNIHPGWHKQSLVVQWLSAMQPFLRWMNYNAAYTRRQKQESWHICGTACNNLAAKEPWCMLQIQISSSYACTTIVVWHRFKSCGFKLNLTGFFQSTSWWNP